MTIIAWDGKVLAADKRATGDGMANRVTKIWRVGEHLLATAGSIPAGMALRDWYTHGAKPAEYPEAAVNNGAVLIVITAGKKILEYAGAYPYEIEDAYYAMGSGRAFATMAMRLGKSAVEAVELTCEFDVSCGNGIDILEHGKRGSAKRR